MIHSDDNDSFYKKLTTKKLLQMLMQEIVDVRRELKEEISELGRKIDHVDRKVDRVDKKVGAVDRKVEELTLKVDQNHITFMHNIDDLDIRVTVLEANAA